jgi:hypothetical protein
MLEIAGAIILAVTGLCILYAVGAFVISVNTHTHTQYKTDEEFRKWLVGLPEDIRSKYINGVYGFVPPKYKAIIEEYRSDLT